MTKIPEQYRETIEQFLAQYWQARRFELTQAFLSLESRIPHLPDEGLMGSVLADTLGDIARTAAGEMPETRYGEVYEAIQSLMERLFASPTTLGTYDIPEAFWATPLGAMVIRALFRVQGDELITITEAAGILGVTTQTVSHHIARGSLAAYPDPAEPNPQKARRVRRSAVEAMRQQAGGADK
jgi:hypothetical protein